MNRRDWIKKMAFAGGGLLLGKGLWASGALKMPLKPLFDKKDFGKDFQWGVATASYQTEGAAKTHGKGESVWDRFTHTPGKVADGSNGDIATDFYHRYETDIDLIRQMNFDVFRFSLSWSRILPQGTGKVNEKGIEFYHKVIDTCLEKGIEPWVTLYHWDLPQALEDKGGWTNRKILDWFANYVEICTKAFGDKVKNWMILNEPMVFTGFGYMTGYHAPGRRGFSNFFPAVHHATLAQGIGGRIVRKNVPQAHIGTTFSCSHIAPKSNAERHQKAAQRTDALFNRLFIEPVLGMGYPIDSFSALQRLERYAKPGDDKLMPFDFDFIGIQNYFRVVTRFALFPPVLYAKEIKAKKRDVPMNEMGMEVYPEGIYKMLKKFGAYKGVKKILVTENGVCYHDTLAGGRIHDPKRIQFFKDYLSYVLKAKNEGVNVQGYFVWTLTDNFEWSEGFEPRFGLVYVDFETQKRYIKDSGLWFKEFLAEK